MSELKRSFSCFPEDEVRVPDTIPNIDASDISFCPSFGETLTERNISCFQISTVAEASQDDSSQDGASIYDVSQLDESQVGASHVEHFRKKSEMCRNWLPSSPCRGEETPGHFLSDLVYDIICEVMLCYAKCNQEEHAVELREILKDLHVTIYNYFMKDTYVSESFTDEIIQVRAERVVTMLLSGSLDIKDISRFVDRDISTYKFQDI
jgi:hypothetical protein